MNKQDQTQTIEVITNAATRRASRSVGRNAGTLSILKREAASGRPTFALAIGDIRTQFPWIFSFSLSDVPMYAIAEGLNDIVVGARAIRKGGLLQGDFTQALRLGQQIRALRDAPDTLVENRQNARWEYFRATDKDLLVADDDDEDDESLLSFDENDDEEVPA